MQIHGSGGFRGITGVFLLLALTLTPAHAHYPWLTVVEEEPLRFEVGWGHEFPSDGHLDVTRLAEVVLVEPDGDRRALALEEGTTHVAGTLAESGVYILAARQVPSFYSLTADGGRRGSRLDHPEALSCSESANSMKALVAHGSGGDPARLLGHPLEILPLVDPAGLKAGDELPVRVLFRGEPFQGQVEATWDTHPDKDEYAVTNVTDEMGRTSIPLGSAGLWLVTAKVQEPHADKALCDYQTYTATLTFRLR